MRMNSAPSKASSIPPASPQASAKRASCVYGPVRSWRFGWSLGIDLLLETSICSFNCTYCQLGAIQRVTTEQRIYVPTSQMIEDLRAVQWNGIDVVTFSGSGEPTLALNLGEAIEQVKSLSGGKPVTILSNATLFRDAATRQRVLRADRVVCKLDAPNQKMFERVNRPAPGVRVEAVVEGIRLLRAEYRGILAFQCMFMPMNVDGAEEIARLAGEIGPDEIQVNTPLRPYPRKWFLGARGAHEPGEVPDGVKLKTISEEETRHIVDAMRRHCPRARILSPLDRPET